MFDSEANLGMVVMGKQNFFRARDLVDDMDFLEISPGRLEHLVDGSVRNKMDAQFHIRSCVRSCSETTMACPICP